MTKYTGFTYIDMDPSLCLIVSEYRGIFHDLKPEFNENCGDFDLTFDSFYYHPNNNKATMIPGSLLIGEYDYETP